MKRAMLTSMLTALALLFSSCVPVMSLLPYYTDSDKLFDGNLVGEWRVVPDRSQTDEGSASDENQRWIFQKTKDQTTYDAWQMELGKSVLGRSTATLVKLGDALFLDLGPGDDASDGPHDLRYPTVDAHLIARVWIEKNEVKMRFLDVEWVLDQVHAGKFPLARVETPNGLILTASTEELRKFLSVHADDKEAFAVETHLVRVQ